MSLTCIRSWAPARTGPGSRLWWCRGRAAGAGTRPGAGRSSWRGAGRPSHSAAGGRLRPGAGRAGCWPWPARSSGARPGAPATLAWSPGKYHLYTQIPAENARFPWEGLTCCALFYASETRKLLHQFEL